MNSSSIQTWHCQIDSDGYSEPPPGAPDRLTRRRSTSRSQSQVRFYRRAEIGTTSLFGKYAHVYLVIAGISLLIDSIDVLRYLVGDGQLLNR